MAGDYKSYSIQTGLVIALCAFWILLPQVLNLNTAYLQVDVFLNTSSKIAANTEVAFPKGRDEVYYNWSLMDRSLLQKIQNTSTKMSTTCNQNSFAKISKKYTLSRGDTCKYTNYNKCKKFGKQQRCTTAILPVMSVARDDDAVHHIHIHASKSLISKNKKDDPNHPNSLWDIIVLTTLASEIWHAIIAQELQRLRHPRVRRVAIGCSLLKGAFWAFVLRVFFLFWVLWFVRAWGFWCEPLTPCLFTKQILHKRKNRISNRYTKRPMSRNEKFNVQVDVLCHGIKTHVHINRTIGDGNCYWRAVAKQTNMTWYKLKKLTTNYMLQHALKEKDDELWQNVKTLKKKNEWASMLAILGTADYLQREIRVCVRGHIIRCSPLRISTCANKQSKHDAGAINLFYENSHYSGVDAADVRHRLTAAKHELSSSLREFLNLTLEAYPKDVTLSRHRMNIGCNLVVRKQRFHLNNRSIARAGQMPPQYRPAGQGLPKRRLDEDFTAQIMRVAKAKSAAPAISTTTSLMKAMRKIPPRPPAPPIKVPKEPPYPPPGRGISQPMTPPKSPMTPPKPPCPRRKPSTATSWSASSSMTNEMTTSSKTPGTSEATASMTQPMSTAAMPKPPEPSKKPLIATATISEDRVQHPRLVRKPRTPPPPRRHMPSAAPPSIELPPTVEDMSGGECTDDSMNNSIQHAPLDALVDRVVDEVSRRVLERFTSTQYMVGLSENAVCDHMKTQSKSHDLNHNWDKAIVSNQSNLRTQDGYAMRSPIDAVSATLPCTCTNIKSCMTPSTGNLWLRLCSGILGFLLGCFERVRYLCLVLHLHVRELGSSGTALDAFCTGCKLDKDSKLRVCTRASVDPQIDVQHQPKNLQQIRIRPKIDKSNNTKIMSTKIAATMQPRKAERERHDASVRLAGMPAASSFAANGMARQWLVPFIVVFSIISGVSSIHFDRVLQGGMLNQYSDEGVDSKGHKQQRVMSNITPLDECARNVLIGECVNIDNIRILLEHPEVPWIPKEDGFQITLGAARLSLTKATSAFPNLTRVITAYMQQCNNKAQGSTIVINKNVKTAIHVDSHNEKLPAYLTAITEYGDGEIFLQSDYGDKSFEGHKGFLIPIPIGNTITIPTFKIPHATNSWKGNRIISVLFTNPIKRIDASRNNLRLQLQKLGFQIPAIDKSWVDCEITGNSQGSPIFSRTASIRGFFTTGEHRYAASDEKGEVSIGNSDCEVWGVSSGSEIRSDHELTRTWTAPFTSQISDIEYCSEEALSPATTILDDESGLQPSDCDDENVADAICRKRKRASFERSSESQRHHADEQRRSSSYSTGWLRFSGTSSASPQLTSESRSNPCNTHPGDVPDTDCDFSRSERSNIDLFGFNNNRVANWSIQSDPIEPYTEDENSCILRGGGAPADEFKPNKADISKLNQKIKTVQHGYAPKQSACC